MSRLEKACTELLRAAEDIFAQDVIGSEYGKKVVTGDIPAKKNIMRIAYQLGILNSIFRSLSEIADDGHRRCMAGIVAIREGKVAQSIKLTVPRTAAESFRRDVLRALFNAVEVRMPDKTMQSFRLGSLWFKSDDDPPRLDMEIPK